MKSYVSKYYEEILKLSKKTSVLHACEKIKLKHSIPNSIGGIRKQFVAFHKYKQGLKKQDKKIFKINDGTAKFLGLELSKDRHYTLNEEQRKIYYNLDVEPIKRLFFDIETSKYIVDAFSIGYKKTIHFDDVRELSKIICICYKWENEDKIHSLDWGDKMDDKELIYNFIKVLDEADEIVAHNGDNFDIKIIRARAIYHSLKMKPKYKSFDTLKKSRRFFKFPNNKLDTIAKYLNVGAKLKHEGNIMWQKCMQGNKEALKDMIKYCKIDIVVLEDVFLTLQNYVDHNVHAGALNGNAKHSCPNCSSENISLIKNIVTKAGTIKRSVECSSCLYNYDIANRIYLNYLNDNL